MIMSITICLIVLFYKSEIKSRPIMVISLSIGIVFLMSLLSSEVNVLGIIPPGKLSLG